MQKPRRSPPPWAHAWLWKDSRYKKRFKLTLFPLLDILRNRKQTEFKSAFYTYRPTKDFAHYVLCLQSGTCVRTAISR